MQHRDFVKAAKELNKAAGTKIKVVAVKGDVLQKAIKETVKSLTNFDFAELSDETLDVFDELKCEMTDPVEPEEELLEEEVEEEPEEETEELLEEEPETPSNVIPMKKETPKETPKERTLYQQGPALIAAAVDLFDVLGYDKEDIEKFKKFSLSVMVTEIQKMADVINTPYEQDGKTITPEDMPSDFKPDTIKVFEANDIKVKWNETPKEDPKPKKENKPKVKIEKKKPQLAFHEYANLFPDMAEDEFNEIVKDMNENGYRPDRPIILFGGKIADGKNRYKASLIAGVDAEYTNFDGTKDELFKHVIALNLKRRHLTPAQRATLGAELLPEFEKAAKQKMKAGGKGKKTDKPIRATEEAAKATGSTKDAISAAKKIKKESPKKFEEMKQGKKTIAAAKRETETKTNEEKFHDAERMLLAKLKMTRIAIHDFIDAAELAEQEIKYQDNLDLIENAILGIIG